MDFSAFTHKELTDLAPETVAARLGIGVKQARDMIASEIKRRIWPRGDARDNRIEAEIAELFARPRYEYHRDSI